MNVKSIAIFGCASSLFVIVAVITTVAALTHRMSAFYFASMREMEKFKVSRVFPSNK